MSARKEAKKKSCAKCSKALKRLVRYYRDGKFFCGKNCYRTMAPAPAAAAQVQQA